MSEVSSSGSSRSGSSQSALSELYDMRRETTKLINAHKKRSGVTKRKRRTKKGGGSKRRRTYNTRGRGVVMTPYGTLTGLGSYENFGRDAGSAIGGHLGGMAHSAFKSLTGFGGYKVRNNSLWEGTDPPQIVNTFGDGSTIIRHREYVGDLLSGTFPQGGTVTQFEIGSWTIQPGNPALFPWLSSIADNFQEWELRGMIVELKTLTSDFSDKSVLGSMFCGTQYNVLEPAPTSKRQLENLQYSTSSKPSESIIHAIECAPNLNAQTHLYVAQDGVVKNGDSRLYDLGTLFLGSQGIPVQNAPIAEIWVSYEIALFKPQLGVPLLASWQWRDYNQGGQSMFGIGPGIQLKPDVGSYSGITVTVGASNADEFTVRFPDLDGEWDIFLFDVSSTNLSIKGQVTVALDPGVGIVPFMPATAGASFPTSHLNNWLIASQQFFFQMRVKITSLDVSSTTPGCTITAGGIVWGSGASHSHTLIIQRVNPEVYSGTNY